MLFCVFILLLLQILNKTVLLLNAPTALFNSFLFHNYNNVGIDEILYFHKSSF